MVSVNIKKNGLTNNSDVLLHLSVVCVLCKKCSVIKLLNWWFSGKCEWFKGVQFKTATIIWKVEMSKPQLNRTYNVVCYLCGRPDLSVGRGRAVNHREGGHGFNYTGTRIDQGVLAYKWLDLSL